MHCLKYSQKLPLSLEECWDFFSNPVNLKLLTPEHMDFVIKNDLAGRRMYAGQIIMYTVRPLWNIPLKWMTEITHVNEPNYFIDEQRFGPYSFWHHEHHFKTILKGVEMTDIIYYKLPFGPLGRLINALKVQSDVEAIFTYRTAKLEKMYGRYQD